MPPTSNASRYVIKRTFMATYEHDGEAIAPASYRNPTMVPLDPPLYMAHKGGYTPDIQMAAVYAFGGKRPVLAKGEMVVPVEIVPKEDTK